MRNRITQLSRFLLLCAVMFLVTMIPQSVKAITVEEAGEAYMTDSQAGGTTAVWTVEYQLYRKYEL